MCGEYRVAQLMKQNKFKANIGYKNHFFRSSPIADNHLQQLIVCERDTAWVADITITYIKMYEGWLYSAVVLDLFSRKIIVRSMQPNMGRSIVIKALCNSVLKVKFGAQAELKKSLPNTKKGYRFR